MFCAAVLAGLLALAGGSAAAETAGPADGQPPARSPIKVMVSPLQTRFTQVLGEHLVTKYGLPPLDLSTVLAATASKAFCAGTGPGSPDVIALPRRMAKREYDGCVENGVIDIIELPVGFDALVLVVKKGDLVFNLTPRAMYFALAAEIPLEDDFVRNDVRRWNDLDPRLPALDINVFGSEAGTSITAFFKEIFMEGGCRGLRQFKVYYSSVDRVKTCTTLRDDGRYVGIKPPIAVNFKDIFRTAPKGAVGVVPYTVYRHNADWLDLLPVSGVLPTTTTIKDDEYEAVTPVRYYVKRKHMDQRLGGDGSVHGLYNFIQEIMSEDAIGDGGYLESLGLVVDDPPDREHDREAALRLQPFRR